jgi:GH24 family phage-related lysozyme (muramidase)
MASLEKLLEKHEGRELKVYPDSEKRPTVGIGHRASGIGWWRRTN